MPCLLFDFDIGLSPPPALPAPAPGALPALAASPPPLPSVVQETYACCHSFTEAVSSCFIAPMILSEFMMRRTPKLSTCPVAHVYPCCSVMVVDRQRSHVQIPSHIVCITMCTCTHRGKLHASRRPSTYEGTAAHVHVCLCTEREVRIHVYVHEKPFMLGSKSHIPSIHKTDRRSLLLIQAQTHVC